MVITDYFTVKTLCTYLMTWKYIYEKDENNNKKMKSPEMESHYPRQTNA